MDPPQLSLHACEVPNYKNTTQLFLATLANSELLVGTIDKEKEGLGQCQPSEAYQTNSQDCIMKTKGHLVPKTWTVLVPIFSWCWPNAHFLTSTGTYTDALYVTGVSPRQPAVRVQKVKMCETR